MHGLRDGTWPTRCPIMSCVRRYGRWCGRRLLKGQAPRIRLMCAASRRPRVAVHQRPRRGKSQNLISPDVSGSWSDPQPLSVKLEPEPYPIDALPGGIRAAVEEVGSFVKSPISLLSSSALAALSLAAQALADAKRAERLQSPIGIFSLGIADSGERKTTGDAFFMSPIIEYEKQQSIAKKPEMQSYNANSDAWQAKRDGLVAAIKDAGKKGKEVGDLKIALVDHQARKPVRPKVPKLLLGDETPESLAWRLAIEWPSAGVISSEAGIVFGAHGMGSDSVMRYLGLLNVLWDGGKFSVGRRTSESFEVKGARLTVALQVQELTLRSFLDRCGLARGMGFLARFLVSWPQSTQGMRPFTEAPRDWPHLTAFHAQLTEILGHAAPISDDGGLSPAPMGLAPDAKAAWIVYHNAIESDLASGGELFDVRDVASKSADNAARLGALFQVFEHGLGGEISLDCLESACRIAAWHLHEFPTLSWCACDVRGASGCGAARYVAGRVLSERTDA